MITLQAALTIATIAVLVGFILGFAVRNRNLNALSFSEALVAEVVERNTPGQHVLLNDVTIEAASGTTQIDHVLVCEMGVFVIETKHYSGWIFGDPAQSQWTQVIYKRKTKFLNPLFQNAGHVKTLKELFTLPSEAFHSVVVFNWGRCVQDRPGHLRSPPCPTSRISSVGKSAKYL